MDTGLVGMGPGAGMGLLFMCTCILGTTIYLSGYLFRSVRFVEGQPGAQRDAGITAALFELAVDQRETT